MSRAVAVIVAAAVFASGCGGGGESDGTRPPLGSPPDPGEVPTDDGLSDAVRGELIDSTVRVTGIACGRTTEGSGFAIADQHIATNAHVLLGVDDPKVERRDGSVWDAVVVAYDVDADLAILRVDGTQFTPLPLGGAEDHTIGALFGWEPGPRPDPTPFRIDRPVSVRIEAVGSTDRIERPSWLLAAFTEAGDSGAALVDQDGVVVGIAYATTTRNKGVAYAVRATELEALIAAGFDDNLLVPDC